LLRNGQGDISRRLTAGAISAVMIVCVCNCLREGACREVACRPECRSLASLYKGLGARVRCGRCIPHMQALLDEAKRGGEEHCACADPGGEASQTALHTA
jgi:bacterioferritin-associated ferredoxin